MLHEITFKNFFSFKDEGILSFRVTDKAPDTGRYFTDETGERLVKAVSVFGYNASGKTNVLKSISFLQWIIVEAYTEKPNVKIPVIPFSFGKGQRPTEVSATFGIGEDIYAYSISLTTERILSEKLQKKSNGKTKFSTLFERVWKEDADGGYLWKEKFGLAKNFRSRLRENASVLAIAIRDEHKESLKISEFWSAVSTNVSVIGKVNDETRNIVSAAQFFDENKELKKEADVLLKAFDLGLDSIDIQKKEETDTRISYALGGVHFGDRRLDFMFESAGTKKLFSILKDVLAVLHSGGVAVLDEFDSDLHPMMSEAIVDMFFSPEKNQRNAQLVFSAHSPHLLNLLDKYHIALVEKNERGESEIWRLDEMEGVRLDENYYAKYLSGAYGAVGNIDL